LKRLIYIALSAEGAAGETGATWHSHPLENE